MARQGPLTTAIASLAAIALILLAYLLGHIASIHYTPLSPNETCRWFSEPSPPYLLLSNWSNMTIYVSTGYRVPSGMWGVWHVEEEPPSIVWLMYLDELLNDSITFYGLGGVKYASLTLNNSIIINGTLGWVQVYAPPYSNIILAIGYSRGNLSFIVEVHGNVTAVNSHELMVKVGNVTLTYYSGQPFRRLSYSTFEASSHGEPIYVEVSVNGGFINPQDALRLNGIRVGEWLASSIKPNLTGCLLYEYYLSLLLLKDDQNPVLGAFAASPEPIYLYAWVRDSSFAAIALQMAGHIRSALRYWRWMAEAQAPPGTWYTRYSFINGSPDLNYGIPEYDSIGLFQIGLWNLYELTHNKSLIMGLLPALNKSLNWEVSQISLGNGLLPEDLSIWEDLYAYNFWTQAIDLVGMYYSAKLLNDLGLNSTWLKPYVDALNSSIVKYFYSGGYFSRAATPTLMYVNGSEAYVLAPDYIYDSSTILPIALGFINPESPMALNSTRLTYRALWNPVVGGLARYSGDTYHYFNYLSDSTGPMPPWVITTMFLALYYEDLGNCTSALNLLKWAVEHSEHGLLPEAVDPNYGYPLPTTSPLTWSAAMYVIASLNLANCGNYRSVLNI